ncbi:hypothetical protein GQX74_006924 [Glossina fuscipes]|nr:hypothetical protein GQX74_006924 [Glossina fuscipes]
MKKYCPFAVNSTEKQLPSKCICWYRLGISLRKSISVCPTASANASVSNTFRLFMCVVHYDILNKSSTLETNMPPPGHDLHGLSDSPDSADTLNFAVRDDDVILVAADVVFDKVPEKLLLDNGLVITVRQ